MIMFSRLALFLLIVLFGTFAFVLLCVPAELSPTPEPPAINFSTTISYGETWEEAQVHSGNESYYATIREWMENDADDFHEAMKAYYAYYGMSDPVCGIQLGWAVTVLVPSGTTIEHIDHIYGWMNESMESVGLRGIPVQFRHGGVFTVSGITLAAEKDSVICGAPQPNYLRFVLLVLCIAKSGNGWGEAMTGRWCAAGSTV